jgi:hypothetical protein
MRGSHGAFTEPARPRRPDTAHRYGWAPRPGHVARKAPGLLDPFFSRHAAFRDLPAGRLQCRVSKVLKGPWCACQNLPWLTAGLRRGAIDVWIHARVVEWAGEDRHRDRAGRAAAADGPSVIAALPGGDAADDKPYDKKHRSDAHLNLRVHRLLKHGETAGRGRLTLSGPGALRKHTRARRWEVRYM